MNDLDADSALSARLSRRAKPLHSRSTTSSDSSNSVGKENANPLSRLGGSSGVKKKSLLTHRRMFTGLKLNSRFGPARRIEPGEDDFNSDDETSEEEEEDVQHKQQSQQQQQQQQVEDEQQHKASLDSLPGEVGNDSVTTGNVSAMRHQNVTGELTAPLSSLSSSTSGAFATPSQSRKPVSASSAVSLRSRSGLRPRTPLASISASSPSSALARIKGRSRLGDSGLDSLASFAEVTNEVIPEEPNTSGADDSLLRSNMSPTDASDTSINTSSSTPLGFGDTDDLVARATAASDTSTESVTALRSVAEETTASRSSRSSVKRSKKRTGTSTPSTSEVGKKKKKTKTSSRRSKRSETKERRTPSSSKAHRKKKRSKQSVPSDLLGVSTDGVHHFYEIQNEPYFFLKRLGRGGSSQVVRVLSRDKNVFALKVIKMHSSDNSHVANYKGEIQVLERLRGQPHVIHLEAWEVKEELGVIFMLFEEGQNDLGSLMKQHAPLSQNLIRYYWHEVLKCVQVCHEQKIIHLDLKPPNFVSVNGTLKIIDFGIAKQVETGNSNDTTSILQEENVGTLNYMAPESISGLGKDDPTKLNRASDIWSLGCILYQMVYGKPPFAHLSLVHKLQALSDPRLKIKLPPHPNAALMDVIARCLQRDPARRPRVEHLLKHPFLHPSSAPGVSKRQVSDIVKQMISISVDELTLAMDPVLQDKLSTAVYDAITHGSKINIRDMYEQLKKDAASS